MSQFAKLYNDTPHGQILVKLDTDHDGGNPEVRFFSMPPGMGVCSLALGFDDIDAGWEAAEAAFEKVDEKKAIEIIGSMGIGWREVLDG